MADISIAQSPAAPALQVRTPQTVSPDIQKGTDSRVVEQKEKESVRTQQEMENLVSVSEDGDTVQVSEEGATRLQENSSIKNTVERTKKEPVLAEKPVDTDRIVTVEDKMDRTGALVDENKVTAKTTGSAVDENKVTAKTTGSAEDENKVTAKTTGIAEDENKVIEGLDENDEVPLAVTSSTKPEEERVIIIPTDQEPVEIQNTDQESYVPQVSSYAGYSDSQLEQMYLKGDISKFDYDQEMEVREEQREAQQEKDTDFSTDMTEQVQKQEQAEQNAASIQSAFSPDASKALEATDRVNIIATLQNMGA